MRFSNPLIRRLDNEPNAVSGNPATLGSIVLKILFFLVLTGIGGFVAIKNPFPEYQLHILIGSGVVAILFPIIGMFAKNLAFLLGSIFSICQGVIVTFLSMQYASLYEGIIPIAVGITVFIFLLTLTLYATGIVKVNQRFKSIVKTLFIGSLLISGIVFISSFYTNTLTNLFLGNGAISIGISALMVIIASASMIIDFDTIAMTVKCGKDKKLEWFAAFGFTISLLWLYLRVLELVAKVMGSSDN